MRDPFAWLRARLPGGLPAPPARVSSTWDGGDRLVEVGGYRVRLDLSRQVLGLSLVRDSGPGFEAPVPLHPTVASAIGPRFLPLASIVHKTKVFDDGLCAAVEKAAHAGAGGFSGKAAVVRRLADALPRWGGAAEEALTLLHAAERLGPGARPPPLDRAEDVLGRVAAFLRDEAASKPVGFYTWSRDLQAIFRHDRILQSRLGTSSREALDRVLEADEELRGGYEACLRLAAGLTNPPAPGASAIFPGARSHEADLVARLYGRSGPPEGARLMDDLVTAVFTGEVSLRPTARSGWYDLVAWSHEPMLLLQRMPEGPRLDTDETYRAALVDLFKGGQALTRETHVKALRPTPTAAAPVRSTRAVLEVPLELTVEPLPTYFERRAAGYRHVRAVLGEAFGVDGLRGLRRLTPDGPVERPLVDEVDDLCDVLQGAEATARRELGMPLARDATSALARFDAWRAGAASDADLARDLRMMVPVASGLPGGRTRAWAFLGWQARALLVRAERPPAATVRRGDGTPVPAGEVELAFRGAPCTTVFPCFAEVEVRRLLDRDAFRRHCDRYGTREAIVAYLADATG